MDMKICMTSLLVGTLFAAGSIQAQQMMGAGPEMMQEYGRQQAAKSKQERYKEMRYHHGMMGGYGCGSDMMHGYGRGYGMMHGYGMGPGMMGDYGMGYGMMGGQGLCQGPMHMFEYGSDQYNAFMNETRETRKQIHDMRFEYGEMMRDPQTTVKDLKQMQKKMYELQQELMNKVFEEE